MTTREFYLSIINGTISDETVAKASEMLSALDTRNEKRKSTESKEKRETAARRILVMNALCDEPMFAESIAESRGLSVGQVRSALSTLVREGIADKTEVKVGKSRKMAYTLHRE